MRIFIFKSEANKGLQAFAADPGGRTLPPRHGPWHAVGVVAPERDPPHKLDRVAIEKAITDQGFQMFRVKPKKVASDG
jgi:hypothetical protein